TARRLVRVCTGEVHAPEDGPGQRRARSPWAEPAGVGRSRPPWAAPGPIASGAEEGQTMRRTRLKVLLLALAFPVLGAVALAQEGAAGADLGARIAELRARAQRLTVLAQLPEEARPEVQALFDRFEDLRQSAQELEVARLEALVASLESGDSPAVAQQVAESAVADRRVELARQREALREDAEDLADRYPEAANLIR